MPRLARRAIRTIAVGLAGFGLAWTLALVVLGGFDAKVFGVRITTHDPTRPLLAAVAALSMFLLAGGSIWPFRKPE